MCEIKLAAGYRYSRWGSKRRGCTIKRSPGRPPMQHRRLIPRLHFLPLRMQKYLTQPDFTVKAGLVNTIMQFLGFFGSRKSSSPRVHYHRRLFVAAAVRFRIIKAPTGWSWLNRRKTGVLMSRLMSHLRQPGELDTDMVAENKQSERTQAAGMFIARYISFCNWHVNWIICGASSTDKSRRIWPLTMLGEDCTSSISFQGG